MTTPNSIRTTTVIRHGVNKTLSISYDFTSLDTLTQTLLATLLSLTDQAIERWWSSLSPSQRSALSVRGLSLRISGQHINPKPEAAPPLPLAR